MPDPDIWIEAPDASEGQSLPLCHWVFMPGRHVVAAPVGRYPWLVRWREPLARRAGEPLPPAASLCQHLAAIAACDHAGEDARPVLRALRAFYRAHGPVGLTGQLMHGAGTPPGGLPWPERAEPVVLVLQHAHEIAWYYQLLQALLEPDQPQRRQRLQHALGPVPQSYAVRVVPERRQRGRRAARRVELHLEALVAEDEPLSVPRVRACRDLASAELRYDPARRQCVVSIAPALPVTPEVKRFRRAGMSFWWIAPGFHALRAQAEGTPGLGLARLEEVEKIAGAVFTDGIRAALVGVPADVPPTLFSHVYSWLAQELLRRLPWRKCAWCGSLIATRTSRRRFCDADCSKEWHNATRGDPDLGKTLPDGVWEQVRELLLPPLARAHTCAYCFQPLPRGRRRLCRDSCANAWRKAQWRRRQAGVTLPDTRYFARMTPGDLRYPSLGDLPFNPSVMFQFW